MSCPIHSRDTCPMCPGYSAEGTPPMPRPIDPNAYRPTPEEADAKLEQHAQSPDPYVAAVARDQLREIAVRRKAEQLQPIVAKTKLRLAQKETHGGVEIHLSCAEGDALVFLAEIGLRSLGVA